MAPFQARAAFVYLTNGGVVRKNKRVDLTTAWEEAWPQFQSELRPAGTNVATARYGCWRNGSVFLRPADNDRLSTTSFAPVLIVPPRDPPADRNNETPLVTRPCELAHFSTPPRASNQCVTPLLSERSLRDLPTQLRFEADTSLPAGPRPWVVDPRFGEWLMGLPEDWTRLGAPPRKRRGRPPAIARGGARPHSTRPVPRVT